MCSAGISRFGCRSRPRLNKPFPRQTSTWHQIVLYSMMIVSSRFIVSRLFTALMVVSYLHSFIANRSVLRIWPKHIVELKTSLGLSRTFPRDSVAIPTLEDRWRVFLAIRLSEL